MVISDEKTTKKHPEKQCFKKYRIDVRMPNSKRITKTFFRKYDADKFKSELFIKKNKILNTGIYINDDIAFKDFASFWLKNQILGRKADKTEQCYKSCIKKYINPVVADIKLRHISYHHARTLECLILNSGRSTVTTNKILRILKAILNDAVKLEYLLRNPIRGYPELKEEPRNLNFWSKKEIDLFISKNQNNELLDLYLITLNTGLRLGEICGLCWDRVDFESGHLIINRSLTRYGLRNTTKGHKGRYVPMNHIVRGLLKKRLIGPNKGFVFSSQDGKPVSYEHMTQREFKKSQVDAGLDKIIRFHDLRHTFASHFMMNGGNIYTLQKILGHSDIKTTMIYAHLDQEFLHQAADIVMFG